MVPVLTLLRKIVLAEDKAEEKQVDQHLQHGKRVLSRHAAEGPQRLRGLSLFASQLPKLRRSCNSYAQV
jgi:hypothetical protein